MADTGHRCSDRAVGAAPANFLPARQLFLEETASAPAESSRIIAGDLRHHFSFTGAPRLRDWEMTHCIHTSCPSPGHTVLDEEVAKKHGFKKLKHLTSRLTHMTKIKIALAAALIAATSSAAFAATAQRYQQTPVFQQSDVALRAGNVDANDWFAVEQSDRASSPYAGGN